MATKGRPPKVTDAQYTEEFDAKVKPRWKEIVQQALDLVFNPATNDKVRAQMIIYLMDRVLGKPAQEVIENVQGHQTITIRRVEGRSAEDIEKFKNMSMEEFKRVLPINAPDSE